MRVTKNIYRIIFAMVLCLSLTACACKHEWINATCTSPVTCVKCGETAGEASGHHWANATCTTPKACSVCGTTEGDSLAHVWTDPNCVEPKTCSVCEQTEGDAIGHSWKDATYSAPKTCSVCGKTEGSALSRPNNNSSGNDSGASNTRICLLCSNQVSRSQTLYCSTHDCAHTNCSYPAKNVNYAWGSYCEFHGCREPGCLSTPIGGTNYCGAHGS